MAARDRLPMYEQQPLYSELIAALRRQAFELGFSAMGITDTDVRSYIPRARAWIDQGNHPPAVDGRTTTAQREPRPAEFGTLRIICLRMDYLPSRKGHIEVLKIPPKPT